MDELKKKFCRNRNQQGFTLIEMLVGLVIGLLFLAFILTIAGNNQQNYRINDSQSNLQNNGRYAMNYLIRAIRDAGFFGCVSSPSTLINNLSSTAAPYNFSSIAISGTDSASGTGSVLAGTDTLTVHGAGNQQSGQALLTPYPASTTSPLYISTSNTFNLGDIVLIGDCLSADVFQITSTPSTGILQHATGGSVTPKNATSSLSKNYSQGSYVYNLFSDTYSIQLGSMGTPSLFKNGLTSATELVTNIENLQILYGEDTDGDGIANIYETASNVSNMANIVSIRISLVALSDQNQVLAAPQSYVLNGQTLTPTDKKMRKVYTSTITLRNNLL